MNFCHWILQIDPGALPLGVSVIDSSVRLYGKLFPRVSDKHKQQMLQHFKDCIKQAKAARQQAIQINIFTAVLCALKVVFDDAHIYSGINHHSETLY